MSEYTEEIESISDCEIDATGSIYFNKDIDTSILFDSDSVNGFNIPADTLSYIRYSDRTLLGFNKSATSSVTMSDSSEYTLDIMTLSAMVMAVTTTANFVGSSNIIQYLSIESILDSTLFVNKLLSSNIDFDVLSSYEIELISLIISNLYIDDSLSCYCNIVKVLSETVTFQDIATRIRTTDFSISSNITFSSAIISILIGALAKTVNIGFSDTVTRSISTNPTISDEITITGATTSQGSFTITISDNFRIVTTLSITGVDVVYCGIALTTQEYLPSMYSGMRFNSFAMHNNNYYACDGSGIYLLEGETDNGTDIVPGVYIDLSSIESPKQKRFEFGYIGLSGDNVALKMISNEGEVDYYVVKGKVKTAKGHFGTEWKMRIEGIDELNMIELIPVIYQKRSQA
jgi:hypothetical protein